MTTKTCPMCRKEHDDFIAEAFPGRDIIQEFNDMATRSEKMPEEDFRTMLDVTFCRLIQGTATKEEQMVAARFIIQTISFRGNMAPVAYLNMIAETFVHQRAKGN